MRCRQFIRTILLIFIVFTGCSDHPKAVVLSDNPGLTQQGKFMMYQGAPLSGMVEEFFDNGKMKSKLSFEDGLMEGTSETWYITGNIESRRNYHLGEKDGLHQGWWSNGKPRFEYHFINGQYHSSFREWYESGKPLHVFQYDRGQEVSAIGWRENGKTYINFVVKNGRKYGLTSARLCYSLRDEQGVYQSPNP